MPNLGSGRHFFGVGTGAVSAREEERCDKIARKHGASFLSVTLPGDGPRYWFEARSRGEPFDSATERDVMREVGSVRLR